MLRIRSVLWSRYLTVNDLVLKDAMLPTVAPTPKEALPLIVSPTIRIPNKVDNRRSYGVRLADNACAATGQNLLGSRIRS
jgi:hypothetical protein